MTRLGRLAGALLLEASDGFFLIGNLKRPCDFAAAGFVPPAEAIDAVARPFVRLVRDEARPLVVGGAQLALPAERGEILAASLAARLLIERNGSVSDRLWRLILAPDEESEVPEEGLVDGRWLVEMPLPLWNIVREAVLKCS